MVNRLDQGQEVVNYRIGKPVSTLTVIPALHARFGHWLLPPASALTPALAPLQPMKVLVPLAIAA